MTSSQKIGATSNQHIFDNALDTQPVDGDI